MKKSDRRKLESATRRLRRAWNELTAAGMDLDTVHLKHPLRNNVTPSTRMISGYIFAARTVVDKTLDHLAGYVYVKGPRG